MPTDSRAQGANLSDEAGATMPHRDGECAAGQAQVNSLPLRFEAGLPGRFIAYRGPVRIGGIELKSGGWNAYEFHSWRRKWSPFGRIRASFAAVDMWGAVAGSLVARLPENRPDEKPQDGAAIERRQVMRQGNEEVRT